MFTLELDECAAINQALDTQQAEVATALTELIQGSDAQTHAIALIRSWQQPLQTAQQQGIAQFKRGKAIPTVASSPA